MLLWFLLLLVNVFMLFLLHELLHAVVAVFLGYRVTVHLLRLYVDVNVRRWDHLVLIALAPQLLTLMLLIMYVVSRDLSFLILLLTHIFGSINDIRVIYRL